MSYNNVSAVSTMAGPTDAQFGSNSNSVVGIVKGHPFLTGMVVLASGIAVCVKNQAAVKVLASSAAPDISSAVSAAAVDGNHPTSGTATNGEDIPASAPTVVAGSQVSNNNKKKKKNKKLNKITIFVTVTAVLKWLVLLCSLTFLARNSFGNYLDSVNSQGDSDGDQP